MANESLKRKAENNENLALHEPPQKLTSPRKSPLQKYVLQMCPVLFKLFNIVFLLFISLSNEYQSIESEHITKKNAGDVVHLDTAAIERPGKEESSVDDPDATLVMEDGCDPLTGEVKKNTDLSGASTYLIYIHDIDNDYTKK